MFAIMAPERLLKFAVMLLAFIVVDAQGKCVALFNINKI